MQKQALISVSDKSGILETTEFLLEHNYKIISTGGTYNFLKDRGFKVTEISEITNFSEILNGRVKTLHPHIHSGILAKRNDAHHLSTLNELNITPIDIVIVNLYPFFENANKELSNEELVEFIDIGGPTMLRAAAKSYFDVIAISEPNDYDWVFKKIKNDELTLDDKKYLAGKVFNLTSAYDAAIAKKLLDNNFSTYFNASYKKSLDLRYGENPHQKAAFYTSTFKKGAMKNFIQHQGKELSFNNIRDMDLAWKVVNEFTETCCCAVKHSTPCGVAINENIEVAYQKAHDCDPISIFGGIVAFNKKVTRKLAEKLIDIFLEIIIAPNFTLAALAILKSKKNLRVIQVTNPLSDVLQYVKVDGGILVQEIDNQFSTDLKIITKTQPTKQEYKDLIFAQKIIKHVKSNAIVIAKNFQTLGIGTGQTNRIWAAQEAIRRAKEKQTDNLVLASDAFFPFRDVVDYAAEQGIKAIIQPGGSVKDKDSIEAANEHNIAMVITGMRHFLH